MKKVRCTLPHASTSINGIAFEPHPDGGMVSVEPVDERMAALLTSIPGYELVGGEESAGSASSSGGRRGGRRGGKKAAEAEAAEQADENKAAEQDEVPTADDPNAEAAS